MGIGFQPVPAELAKEFPILHIAAPLDDSPVGRVIVETIDELGALDRSVATAHSMEDALAAITTNPSYCCIVLSLDLIANTDGTWDNALHLVRAVRKHNPNLPIFLGSRRAILGNVPLELVEQSEGYIWAMEDSPRFIAGRIDAAARRYLNTLLPPFFGAMVNFDQQHEYSWHTPGHAGGTAFMKTAVGRAFLDFYGEQMLRSDLSVSVGELGSLDDHSGPVAEAERYAARVFGADQTYFSIGGSSASNEIILQSAVADGDIVLVDRNCHKSLNYALNISGAIPVYLMPKRNPRGVIGPVPPEEMTPEAIKKKIEESPLVKDKGQRPVMAVLTNSTYDGLCYNVQETTRLLSQSVDRIHYDEAWYAYARFNSIYEGRYGMHQGPRSPDEATISVTHSTHKLLAALSQASMIHIRCGRVPVEPGLFNEAFMMHTSTSPQYGIIASNDVSTKMMADAGPALTDESIREAIDFRQEMLRIGTQLRERDAETWWFAPWNAERVGDVPFIDAAPDRLATDAEPWSLAPGASWHGYNGLSDGYCMLDPIKVTILTPGLSHNGELGPRGIPAPIVTSFLATRGIVVEKTEPYSFLVLFSIGITKGKWGSLVTELLKFKELYDSDASLEEVLPDLVEAYPERYGSATIKQLVEEMHHAISEHNILSNMDQAFEQLPEPVLPPREAYGRLVHGQVEQVRAAELCGRTLAVQVVPYPPGIPVLMPGERFTDETAAIGDFLVGLQDFDARFPGFEHEIHGVQVERGDDGKPYYMLYCVKD